jgi:hypothetical protein
MADQRLVDYLRNGMSRGYDEESLRQALLRQGWHEQEVEQAMGIARAPAPMAHRGARLTQNRNAGPAQPQPGRPAEGMGFKKRVHDVITSPTGFFNAVKPEAGTGRPFRYLAVLCLIPLVMVIAFFTLFMGMIAGFLGTLMAGVPGFDALGFVLAIGGVSFIMGAAFGALAYAALLVFPFISAAVLHLFAYIFGAKKGYSNTYKAVVYSMTPSLLLGWIPFVGIIAAFWTWYLSMKGLSVLHEISMGRAFLITITPSMIMAVLILVMLLTSPTTAFTPAASPMFNGSLLF